MGCSCAAPDDPRHDDAILALLLTATASAALRLIDADEHPATSRLNAAAKWRAADWKPRKDMLRVMSDGVWATTLGAKPPVRSPMRTTIDQRCTTSCSGRAPLPFGARRHGAQRSVRMATSSTSAAAPPSTARRGVLILPGLGNNSSDYVELAQTLQALGLEVETASVSRPDWSRNAAALTDSNWWRGTLRPRPAVDWYLTKVDAAMQALKRRVDGAPITVLTHSAGGWLGRVYLKDFGTAGVDRFVSLGSPHQPPPEGVLDQTRGILTYCSDAIPGAFHPEIQYTTVASNFVKGARLDGEGTLLAKFAGAGYQQVCGEAEVEGDFIVPVAAAHLEGAINLNLQGAFHSPLGAKLTFLGPWYGSPEYLSLWVEHLGDVEASALTAVAGAEAAVPAPVNAA